AAYSWNQQRESLVFRSVELKLHLQFPVITNAGGITTSRIWSRGDRISQGLVKNAKYEGI
ncbi:hypothetical protein OAF83_02680, partial [Rubripirellula sp.]